ILLLLPPVVSLSDRDWVHRRTDAALDGERRRDQQAVIAAVGRARLGQRVQVEHLAAVKTEMRAAELGPWLKRIRELVGSALPPPRIAGDRRDLRVVDPVDRLKRHAGCRATGV